MASRGGARAKPVSRVVSRIAPVPPRRSALVSDAQYSTRRPASSSSSSSSSSLRVMSMSSLDDEEGGNAFSTSVATRGTRGREYDSSSRTRSWSSADDQDGAEMDSAKQKGQALLVEHYRREGGGHRPQVASQEKAGSDPRRGRSGSVHTPQVPRLPAVINMQMETETVMEELEGRKTVEARVMRKWARWLCRCALVPSPTPQWCSDLRAPELPLPDDVKISVLMALILGQVLPPSALPPSLVSTMTSIKEKERWSADKDEGKGEKISSVVRRVIDQALSVLRKRVSDRGKTMPNAALLFNGAPVAVMHTLQMCKAFALHRIQGELDEMLQWYQACMRMVARRMAGELEITLSEEEQHLSSLLSLQGVIQKDRLPAQLWSAFRNGLAFGCGVFLYLEAMQKSKSNAARGQNRATSAGLDFGQLFADPRLVAHLQQNLEHVFQNLSAAGLPLIWTPMAFLTYPDDEDAFLLIQAYVLYQVFSRAYPLRRLELNSLDKARKLEDNKQDAPLPRVSAFRDIQKVLGRSGTCGACKVYLDEIECPQIHLLD